MPTTKFLLEDSGATKSGEGFEITEAYMVEGIGGNPQDKTFIALTAPDVPQLGDPHQGGSTAFLSCVNQAVSFKGPTQAKVVCSFRVPRVDSGEPPAGDTGAIDAVVDLGTISVGATASTRESFEDIKGARMVVSHFVEKDDGLGGTTTELVEQVRSASIVEPQTVLRVTRLEIGSPDVKAREFVGTVNNKPMGKLDRAGVWLCTRIDGTSNDGGETYSVTYEFQRNRLPWGFIARFIDADTGLPILAQDLNTGDEDRFYETYVKADFSQLGIKFEGP